MASGFKVKRRVWVFLLFAFVSGGGWWVWTSSQIKVVSSPPVQERPEPAVRLATSQSEIGNEVLREQARYLDPAPLFFPTEWNYGNVALKEGIKREPKQVFEALPAKYIFGDQLTKTYGAEQNQLSGRLSDVAAAGNIAPFAGMGQQDVTTPVLTDRDGFLEIKSLKDGKMIVSQVLEKMPGNRADFAPLEFLISVSPAGLVADPILINGAGKEELEVSLRTYLAKSFHVGERLAPGKYLVLIGP